MTGTVEALSIADLLTVIAAIANVGAITYLAKKYSDKVDKHNETLPAISVTLQNLQDSTGKMVSYMDELFHSRNDHEARIVTLEKTHDMKGCNLPMVLPHDFTDPAYGFRKENHQ